MNLTRQLGILIAVLSVVVIGEMAYYGYLNASQKPVVNVNNPSKTAAKKPTPTPLKAKSLSVEDLSIIGRSQAADPLHLTYDEKKDRFFFDIPGKAYVEWRKNMKADYDTWNSIGALPKDRIESLIVIDKVKGVFSDPDPNKMIEGKKYFQYTLTTSNGISMKFWENEDALKKTLFVRMINGVEKPMKMEDLKDGDIIIREGKTDLAIPPSDPKFFIEAKFIKL